ncbi:SUMF1/EgtB/PvdO family nonheme iron enzyme [Streptomyces sp. NPDC088146]|uniref:SUMF1/EgtB/PvdO family nonheme iron enzyme n=1 Tax=Streptomyces sp. NPDC088146 TaxID=3365829 RepID=UPI0038272880
MSPPVERCCAPPHDPASAPACAPAPAAPRPAVNAALGSLDGMVRLPGGTFLMGSNDAEGFPSDTEGPVREVRIGPFHLDAHAVTNDRFAAFVADTGYRTDAERIGWSHVFAGFLPARLRRTSPRPERTPWWCGVTEARKALGEWRWDADAPRRERHSTADRFRTARRMLR